MIRVPLLRLALLSVSLVLGFAVSGCTPESRDPTNVDRTGGTGGGGRGGSGGRGGAGAAGTTGGTTAGSGGTAAGSGGATAGSGGAGGSVGGSGGTTGGTAGGSTGGSGGAGGASDAPVGTGGSGGAGDAPVADAAPEAGGEVGLLMRGEPVTGRDWLRLCPKAWSKQQCCELLCDCLPELCSDSPMDKARFGNCTSMCMGLTDFRARCQAYHCFESKNPRVPQDHVSHCGHASGRVGGGSCTIITNQQ